MTLAEVLRRAYFIRFCRLNDSRFQFTETKKEGPAVRSVQAQLATELNLKLHIHLSRNVPADAGNGFLLPWQGEFTNACFQASHSGSLPNSSQGAGCRTLHLGHSVCVCVHCQIDDRCRNASPPEKRRLHFMHGCTGVVWIGA